MKEQNLKKLILCILVLLSAVALLYLECAYAGEVTYEFYGIEQDESLYIEYYYVTTGTVEFFIDTAALTDPSVWPMTTLSVGGNMAVSFHSWAVPGAVPRWAIYNQLTRSYIGFDTSFIPPTSHVNSAILSVYGSSSDVTGIDELMVYPSAWGVNDSPEPIVDPGRTIDWASWTDTLLGSLNGASFVVDAYNDIVLTDTSSIMNSIANEDKTYFTLKSNCESGDPYVNGWSRPAGFGIKSANESGTSMDPKLTVTFATHPINGYVRRFGTNEGINGIKVTVSGGSLATPGGPAPGPIVLTTQDGPQGPGYYETPYEVLSGTYTVHVSNP